MVYCRAVPDLGQRGFGSGGASEGGELSQSQIVVCSGGDVCGFVGLFMARCRVYFAVDLLGLDRCGSGGGGLGGGDGLSQLQTGFFWRWCT